MRARLPLPVLLGLLATAGCDGSATPDAGAADAGHPDAGPADAGTDAGRDAGPARCPEGLADRRVALDDDGSLTQIHPAVAFDGRGLWVAWVRPEAGGGGGFDVFASRVGCDGRPLVAPFAAQSAPAGNDIDPAVAVDGDAVLLSWQRDDGTGVDNLEVGYRLFDRDGTPRGEDRTLRTTHEGAPVEGNHMGAKLAARPGGGFVVAGARALPGLDRFAAYAQPLTADGALDGPARDPAVEAEVGQTAVAVDAAPDGTIWVAYDRQPDGGDPAVVAGALDAAPPAPVLDDPALSAGADLLATDDAVWVALSGERLGERDLRLVDVSRPLAERRPLVVGEAGRVDHTPRLARSADGAMAVAWFRQIRGFENELWVARFTPTPDGPPVLGEPVRVDRIGVPAYEPALAHAGGDFWFVAFAEGDNPNFRVIGRFVALPSP